jgi:hypothetical protein
MAKARGYPDRRGMGAQSDFISESFIPSEQHQKRLRTMADALVASGISRDEVTRMLSLPPNFFENQELGQSGTEG